MKKYIIFEDFKYQNALVFLLPSLVYCYRTQLMADLFFDGRLGQLGEIRVEYNPGGHLSCIKVL